MDALRGTLDDSVGAGDLGCAGNGACGRGSREGNNCGELGNVHLEIVQRGFCFEGIFGCETLLELTVDGD